MVVVGLVFISPEKKEVAVPLKHVHAEAKIVDMVANGTLSAPERVRRTRD
jgi:hypothetical protein